MKKVNILGTDYEIHFVDEFPEYLKEVGECADGLCNRYDKDIFIKRCNDKDMTAAGRERCDRDTLRHEIIHAYLSESGLSANASHSYGSWAENEEMVDWFAIQSPKIYQTFKEVGCL